MLYYGMIVLSTVLFSLQFLFNSGYERECGSGWPVALNFAILNGIFGALFAFAMGGFRWEFSWFSLLLAVVTAINNLLYTYSTIKALAVANLSLFSMLAMLGGMLLPYVYGLCIGEPFKWTGLLCCLLIAAALLLTVEKGGSKRGALIHYAMVFITNGMSGVLASIHQKGSHAISSNGYLLLSRLALLACCLLLLLINRRPAARPTGKAIVFATGHSLLNTGGNLLMLLALLHLPATVQYPIVTGGVIVLSAVIDFLRKERVPHRNWIAVAIAFAASVCMAL